MTNHWGGAMKLAVLAVAVSAVAAPCATARAQTAVSLQSLLDLGFEVKSAINQGGGYELVLQKEASVYVCSVLTSPFAVARGAPKSNCAKLSAK